MTDAWAAAIDRDSARWLGILRLVPDVEIRAVDNTIWLRGSSADHLDTLLRGIPGLRRFRIIDGGELVPADARVPVTVLPSGDWIAIAEWISVEVPATIWPGDWPEPVELRFVRSTRWREATLLVTEIEAWTHYVADVSQVRLDRWSFAVDAIGRVLVRGLPLPSLPGVRCYVEQGIAVPLGYEWRPLVEANTLRRVLNLGPEELALRLQPEQPWERIPADAFVRATRSAVRLSREAHDVTR